MFKTRLCHACLCILLKQQSKCSSHTIYRRVLSPAQLVNPACAGGNPVVSQNPSQEATEGAPPCASTIVVWMKSRLPSHYGPSSQAPYHNLSYVMARHLFDIFCHSKHVTCIEHRAAMASSHPRAYHNNHIAGSIVTEGPHP